MRGESCVGTVSNSASLEDRVKGAPIGRTIPIGKIAPYSRYGRIDQTKGLDPLVRGGLFFWGYRPKPHVRPPTSGTTCGELMFAIGGNDDGCDLNTHRPPHPLEGVHLGGLYKVI